MTFAVRVLVLIALALSTTACGGNSGSDPGTEPERRSTLTTAEKATIAAALASWRKADTGRFEQVTRFSDTADGPRQVTSGEYELSSRKARFSLEYLGFGGDPLRLEFVTLGDVAYMQAPAWPAAIRGCWLVVDTKLLESTAGIPAGASLEGLPPNLDAWESAQALDPAASGASLRGTVDLAAAVSMFLGSRFLTSLDKPLDGRLQADFTLDGARISSWRVTGTDLFTALTLSGVASSDELSTTLGSADSEVSYSEIGQPVEIEAPPENVRMTGAQMEARICG